MYMVRRISPDEARIDIFDRVDMCEQGRLFGNFNARSREMGERCEGGEVAYDAVDEG